MLKYLKNRFVQSPLSSYVIVPKKNNTWDINDWVMLTVWNYEEPHYRELLIHGNQGYKHIFLFKAK
jgi:tetrahydrodipicolinate N-succinyltransferase